MHMGWVQEINIKTYIIQVYVVILQRAINSYIKEMKKKKMKIDKSYFTDRRRKNYCLVCFGEIEQSAGWT